MKQLIQWDHYLFKLINQEWSNPFFDWFFPFWTDVQKTGAFYILILPLLIGLIYWKSKWRGIGFLISSVIVVGIADKIASKLIKPIFNRPRPLASEISSEVILRISEVGGGSLPSSHSLDAFALAAFVSFYFKNWAPYLFGLAFLTSYSRVYCGVHFPGDVTAGAFFGILIGLILAFAFRPVARRLLVKTETP